MPTLLEHVRHRHEALVALAAAAGEAGARLVEAALNELAGRQSPLVSYELPAIPDKERRELEALMREKTPGELGSAV